MSFNTKSDKFMQNREAIPVVSPQMYKAVSQYRRSELDEDITNGKMRESGSGGNSNYFTNTMVRTSASNVIAGGGIKKSAQLFSGSGTSSGTGYHGSGGTVRQGPEMYSPLWLNSNLNLPRDRATINAWCRSFFALNPVVQNAVSLHSTYPIAKLNIKCEDPKVQQFFETMSEELDLMNICVQIAQEYWTLGESFIYADLDESAGKWSRLLIQNPDYMVVKRSVIANEPIISLRPDENLRRICTSNKPSDIQQRQQLEKNIIEHVRRGENIPFSNFFVSHLARRISPYEIRGTSLLVGCFRALMLLDKIRECDFTIADEMITPFTIVKIGGGADNYKPTPADLEFYREAFEAAHADRNFKLFTHDGVNVERIGYGQGIYDTTSKVQQLMKELYIGLMVPNVIMDGGGDVTYANGGVTLDVLRQRYFQFRNMLSAWLRRKIFAPISKINDFYNYKNKQKVLIVPDIEWNHMSLFDMSDYIQTLTTLSTGQQKFVSSKTLYRSLGLEYDDEIRKIRKEMIDTVIQQKEMESLAQMPLNELRALDDNKEIQEVQRSPLPGESPYESKPEGGAPGGLPGEIGGGGGLTGMPGGLGGGPPTAPPAFSSEPPK